MAIFLQDDEVVHLFRCAGNFRDQCILGLEVFCGMRHGEVGLCVSGDVLEPNKSIKQFVPVYSPRSGRALVRRWQPIPSAMRLMLRNLIVSVEDSPLSHPLFPSSHRPGEPMTGAHIGRIVSLIFQEAGLEHPFPGHALRATYWRHFDRSRRLIDSQWCDMIMDRVLTIDLTQKEIR